MRVYLIALTTAALLLISPLNPSLAATTDGSPSANPNELDLPTALDEDIFDDLPFEQRRQELREEVERSVQKPSSPSIPPKYSPLIQ